MKACKKIRIGNFVDVYDIGGHNVNDKICAKQSF